MSCHSLRVWERRYGFPRPHRTASGHRRYTREQIGLLLRVVELVQRGQSIGDLMAAISLGRIEPVPGGPVEETPREDVEALDLVDRLVAGDVSGGETYFDRMAREYEPADLIFRVIEPAMVEVGERWFRKECDVYQERSVTLFLQRKLEVLIDEARRSNRSPTHTLLAGTVQGDRHSGGVLMIHLLLERLGWRVYNMGVDLPVLEYEKAVKAWRPDALGLSFVLSRNINKRFQELARIREVPIFVGGRSILNYQGLARKHGLFPVTGVASSAVGRLLDDYRAWIANGGTPPIRPETGSGG